MGFLDLVTSWETANEAFSSKKLGFLNLATTKTDQ